jgi:predicted kinase
MRGAGKTTLARKLAPALELPLIARDDLKESLFETLGWSQRLGGPVFHVDTSSFAALDFDRLLRQLRTLRGI